MRSDMPIQPVQSILDLEIVPVQIRLELLPTLDEIDFRNRSDSCRSINTVVGVQRIYDEIIRETEERSSPSRESTISEGKGMAEKKENEEKEEEVEEGLPPTTPSGEQRAQAERNLRLSQQLSPILKYKAFLEMLEKERKRHKSLVRRKFSLTHSLALSTPRLSAFHPIAKKAKRPGSLIANLQRRTV